MLSQHAGLSRAASGRSAVLAGAAATILVALLTGCARSEPGAAADPSHTAEAGKLPPAHVHGVAIDPGDGRLRLATHEGLFEVGDGGRLTAVGPVIDLMGFAVAGPDHYLASGHPGLRIDLPQPVGLVESTDGGETWEPLSRQGQSDFHALTVSDAGVLGYDGTLVRSADGRTWEQLQIPVPPHSLAAAPEGAHVLATTPRGLLQSFDGGTAWSLSEGAPLLQVVTWSDDGTTAVGVDPAGTVWTSTDQAASWRKAAQLGAEPHAVTATSAGQRIAVVTETGLLESTDGGQTFTVVLER